MTIRLSLVGLIPNMRFSPGQIVLSTRVQMLARENRLDPGPLLLRHLSADWGDVGHHDRRRNDVALRRGGERLLSSYQVTADLKVWIITEADRSVTTVLLPDEY